MKVRILLIAALLALGVAACADAVTDSAAPGARRNTGGAMGNGNKGDVPPPPDSVNAQPQSAAPATPVPLAL